jgi:DNA-directed RNA polymerase subunit RPC12/RpoP
MRPFSPGGGAGRREIPVACPDCGFRSTVPPAAVARNAYFCSGCGKSLDLSQAFRPVAPGEAGAAAGMPPPRRDRGTSRYKSARKGRR